MLGCATPDQQGPPPAIQLLEDQFPLGKRVLRPDDGLWLLDFLFQEWSIPRPLIEAEREIDRHLHSGYSVEEALLQVLPTAGMWAHAEYGSWPDLAARTAAGVPVVVQLSMPSEKRRVRRFAIVREVQKGTDLVFGQFADGEKFEMPGDLFRRRWALYRNWMLTACPPDRATWPMRSAERMSLIRFNDQLGRTRVGDDLARMALEAEPDNPDLLAALGSRCIQRGLAREAETLLRRALEINELHVRAANNLAFLLATQKRELDDALHWAQRAVSIEPSNPRVLHTLGLVHATRGEWAQAVAEFERAWRRSASLPLAARAEIGFSLIRACLAVDSLDRAHEVGATLCKLNPELDWPSDLKARLDPQQICR